MAPTQSLKTINHVRVQFEGGGLLSGHWLDSKAPKDAKSVAAIMQATGNGKLNARCCVGDDELSWLPRRKPKDVRQYWFKVAKRVENGPTLLLVLHEVNGLA